MGTIERVRASLNLAELFTGIKDEVCTIVFGMICISSVMRRTKLVIKLTHLYSIGNVFFSCLFTKGVAAPGENIRS